MARINNGIRINTGFNVSSSGPIDSRMRVEYVTDLVSPDTWPNHKAPVYDGMVVVVTKDSNNNPLGEAWILPQATKWNKYGIGFGSGTDEEEGGWIKVSRPIFITGDDVDE